MSLNTLLNIPHYKDSDFLNLSKSYEFFIDKDSMQYGVILTPTDWVPHTSFKEVLEKIIQNKNPIVLKELLNPKSSMYSDEIKNTLFKVAHFDAIPMTLYEFAGPRFVAKASKEEKSILFSFQGMFFTEEDVISYEESDSKTKITISRSTDFRPILLEMTNKVYENILSQFNFRDNHDLSKSYSDLGVLTDNCSLFSSVQSQILLTVYSSLSQYHQDKDISIIYNLATYLQDRRLNKLFDVAVRESINRFLDKNN